MPDPVIGNCSKHPGFNFINCPLCEIDKIKKEKDKEGIGWTGSIYYSVQYANHINIQLGRYYGDKNILDAEQVGEDQARIYGEIIAELLNRNMDLITARFEQLKKG